MPHTCKRIHALMGSSNDAVQEGGVLTDTPSISATQSPAINVPFKSAGPPGMHLTRKDHQLAAQACINLSQSVADLWTKTSPLGACHSTNPTPLNRPSDSSTSPLPLVGVPTTSILFSTSFTLRTCPSSRHLMKRAPVWSMEVDASAWSPKRLASRMVA